VGACDRADDLGHNKSENASRRDAGECVVDRAIVTAGLAKRSRVRGKTFVQTLNGKSGGYWENI
jgi:hypothetical protein